MPVLSLCLPTYNRAVLLTGALGAVLSQVTPAMSGLVEVVVLDNASPDDTPDVVSRAQSEHPHVDLRYVRRPANIGPDANFCDAPNQALGEFVYLLSDDDVLLPGAVKKLLTVIREHAALDAVALDVRVFLLNPDPEAEAGEGVFRLMEDAILKDRDSALSALGTHITFMSCIAFRRLTVAGRDYTDKSATNLAQAYMFVDALAPGRGLYVTSQCFLTRRDDNNEGFDFFRVFVTNFAALMQYARQAGCSSSAVQSVMNKHLDFIYEFLMLFKRKGRFGKIRLSYFQCLDGGVRLLKVYGLNRFVVLTLMPRLLTPRTLFGSLQNVYTGIKKRLVKSSAQLRAI